MKTSSAFTILRTFSVFITTIVATTLPFIQVYAQTGGPAQPEFSTFEPVGTSNMVSPFDGSFTYNLPVITIPGPDGSGYALSLSYHSEVTPANEASWVGYGWTMNPGSIVRNTRGLPDDYNGEPVVYWNKTGKVWTVAGTATFNFEALSKEGESPLNPATYSDFMNLFSISSTLRYNNRKGFGYTNSITSDLGIGKVAPWAQGVVSLGFSVEDGNEGSWSLQVNPARLLSNSIAEGVSNKTIKSFLQDNAFFSKGKMVEVLNNSAFSYSDVLRPVNTVEYEGESYNLSYNFQFTGNTPIFPFFFPVGMEVGLNGSYTWQENKPLDVLNAYGYMYSGYAGKQDMMDYAVENLSPYSKRDKFLGIPFANADNYTLTGEGLGGGFRLHTTRAGHFYPNQKLSTTTILQAGGESHIGPNFGLGFDAGTGWQTLRVIPWDDQRSDGTYGSQEGEFVFPKIKEDRGSYFFRFNNDLGGSVAFSTNDAPSGASKTEVSDEVVPEISSSIHSTLLSGTKRSSYIGYRTNEEMSQESDPRNMGVWKYEDIPYNSYNKAADSRGQVYRDNIADGIGEFAVYNEAGYRYVYGLPVYSRNEKNLQFGVQGLSSPDGYMIASNNAVNINGEIVADIVVGEERDAPYASMHLLTEITTPDYVDRTGNGPTSDDFGGYTKFSYERLAGTTDKKQEDEGWYKWRIPYKGMIYQRNSLSDPLDDLGTMSSGEREVYYLKSIETKTHIALFHTSSREDAYEADHNEYNAISSTSSNPNYSTNNSKAVKLDRIELWSKDAEGNPNELVQTTHFSYSYDLAPNQPNSKSGGGKLTLEKVWFEYGDVHTAKISPYEFVYTYPTGSDYADEVGDAYPEITGYGDQYEGNYTEGSTTKSIQNPPYSPLDIDRWGYYQRRGTDRHKSMQSWVTQAPDEDFDPAAWHLKRIKLPSGGEVHVQYEQNDYSYVQDEAVMAMVRLEANNSTGTVMEDDVVTDGAVPDRYYLDVQDLGLDPNQATYDDELDELKNLIAERFVPTSGDNGEKEKMYFKYLYALTGYWTNHPLDACNSEYITGYVRVKNVAIDASATPKRIYVELGSDNGDEYDIPREVCLDFLQKERGLNVNKSDCSGTGSPIGDDPPFDVTSVFRVVMRFMGLGFLDFYSDCKKLAYTDSYLRIPMTRPKKGGGVRVKRLLTYDAGIPSEEGSASLYGTEYIYQNESGGSSGVATNEPTLGNEENALVKEIAKREDPNWFNRIVAGADKEQFEGPIGESILPGPSIGYSRVVMQDINRWDHVAEVDLPYEDSINTTGHTIAEYYTAKDYPAGTRHTEEAIGNSNVGFLGGIRGNLSNNSLTTSGIEKVEPWTTIDEESPQAGWLVVPTHFYSYSNTEKWLSQGYSFILNYMHGQPKRTSTYNGYYYSEDPDKLRSLTSSVEYTYFQPGEPVPLISSEDEIGKPIAELSTGYPGKEMEVIFESRAVEDEKNDASIELDPSIGMIAPPWNVIFFFTGMPSFSYSYSALRTHVTTKVVRYPAIVKRVVTYNDGISDTVENLAFDPETGSAILTRTNDGFHSLALGSSVDPHQGEYHSYALPASHSYEAMGQKAVSEGTAINSGETVTIRKRYLGDVTTNELEPYVTFTFLQPGTSASTIGRLTPGDLIQLTTKSGHQFAGLYHVQSVNNHAVALSPVSYAGEITYPDTEVNIQVLNSARANQLGASVGSITTYGTPVAVTSDLGPIQSLLTDRNAIVDALNTELNALQQDPNKIPRDFDLDMGIRDVEGTCRQRTATNWVHLEADAGDQDIIRLKVDTRLASEAPASGSLKYPVNSHPFVHDLNAMLNRVWGRELQHLPSLANDIAQGLSSNLLSCNECPVPNLDGNNELIVRYSPADIPAGATGQTIRDQVLEELMISTIQEREYSIAGSTQNGSYILKDLANQHFPKQTNYSATDFLVDLETEKVKSTGMKVRIADPSNPTVKYFDIYILAQQAMYDGISGYDGLTFAGYLVFEGPSDIQHAVCEKDFDASESGNEELFTTYYGDRLKVFTNESLRLGNDEDGYLTIEVFENTDMSCDPNGPATIQTGIQLFGTVPDQAEECVMVLTESNDGQFELDPATLEIIYQPSQGTSFPVTCLEFCDDFYPNRLLEDGVIAAGSQSFSDDWTYDEEQYTYEDPAVAGMVEEQNSYEKGFRGKWRPDGGYVYRTSIKGGAGTFGDPNERVYDDAGVYQQFTLYNARNPEQNDPNWLKPYNVTRYSPRGVQIEGHDILGIYSTSTFSHQETVPAAIAQNASYGSIAFESFEDGKGNAAGIAHSGVNSIEVEADPVETEILRWTYTTQSVQDGASIKLWERTEFNNNDNRDAYLDPDNPAYREAPFVDITFSNTDETQPQSWSALDGEWKRIARTGEWTLYEYTFSTYSFSNYITLGDNVRVIARKPNLTAPLGGTEPNQVWLDDIRIQPQTSGMNAYVYDEKTLRLLATFDDQHFGVYYQYNDEGKLVRILRETERGLKTVQETQYHRPEVSRNGSQSTLPIGGNPAMSIASLNDRRSKVFSADGNDIQVDMLNVQIGPDSADVKIFGVNPDQLALPTIDALSVPDLDNLQTYLLETADLSDMERTKLLKELRELDNERKRLEELRQSDLSEEETKQIDQHLNLLKQKKTTLLQEKLGATDETLKEWYTTSSSEGGND